MEFKILILALFLAFYTVQSELLDQRPTIVTVSKCCDDNEIMVEIHPNIRMCKKRKNYLHIDIQNKGIQSSLRTYTAWEPAFFDEKGHEVAGPRDYAIMHGTPFDHGNCNKRGEILYPVVHNRKNGNEMMLFENGTLSHRMVLQNGEHKSDRYYYDKTKYCLDDLIGNCIILLY